MRLHFRSFLTISVLVFSISANAADGPVCAVDKRAEWQRSVVIAEADREVFKASGVDFSFRRTIEQILRTAKVADSDKPAKQIAAVQSMIETFKLTSAKHPVGGRIISFDARTGGEANMTAAALLDPNNANGMHPIGLFNRFDQAPADWAYCGEHRIVYAQGDTTKERAGTLDRFFLIFEAAVVNPRPELKEEGCRPVAEVWQQAKTTGRTVESIAKDFEKLYYIGAVSSDSSFSVQPVIHAEHYGNPHGQVRGNIFKKQPWQLRQWRVDPLAGTFEIRPNGTNPQPAVYAPSATPDGFDPIIRTEYQQLFVAKLLDQLTEADLGRTSDADLINRIGMGADLVFKFDDFISDSQGPQAGRQDDPNTLATSASPFIDEIRRL